MKKLNRFLLSSVVKPDKTKKQPDYYTITEFGSKAYTITGWKREYGDINMEIEEITLERLSENRFLNEDYQDYIKNNKVFKKRFPKKEEGED